MNMNKKAIAFAAVAAIAACGLVCTVRADEVDPEICVAPFEWGVADLVGIVRILSEDVGFEPPRSVDDYDVNDDGLLDMSDYCAVNEWVAQTSVDYGYWVSHEELWLPQLYDLLWCYEQETGVTPGQSRIGIGVDPVSWLDGSDDYSMQVCFSQAMEYGGYDFTAQDPWYNYIGYPSDAGVQQGDIVMTLFIWSPDTKEPEFIKDRFDCIIERMTD